MIIEIFSNGNEARVYLNSQKHNTLAVKVFSGNLETARLKAKLVADTLNDGFSRYSKISITTATVVDHTKKKDEYGVEWTSVSFDELPKTFFDRYINSGGAAHFYRPACWKVADDVDTKKIADEVKAKAYKDKVEADKRRHLIEMTNIRRRKAFEQAKAEFVAALKLISNGSFTRQQVRARAEEILKQETEIDNAFANMATDTTHQKITKDETLEPCAR
jgi:hypothetical protein